MTVKSIDFPNLGIHLADVGDHITVFGFDIAYYGMVIGLGVLAGVLLAYMEAKRTGQKAEDYIDLAIFGVIVGVLGARLYYVIFSWDQYQDDLLSIFNIRQGGLAIYGGIIGAVIAVLVFAKYKKKSPLLIFDTIAMSLPIGQALGRWGNFFNREVFGEYTDNLVAMRLPLDAVRASDVSEKMREHLEVIDGIKTIQVHPTFLYESLWCVMIILVIMALRRHKKFDGEFFLIYMCLYGIGRFIFEGIRTDTLFLIGTTIPVSQVLAAIFAVIAGGLLIFGLVRSKRNKKEN
ncbi:prolipoprotein diacylglyceryl transferase [Ohessyouella blattaphilus]|uniref:Phosphatidylglycerol--prolipoprotein diacylglyceryl transferase n=1 Tax=Ohessyouella blattaphilus TaxID=2949333 RepID=A0ABT1EE69_9FIRM|nr:prolipoprotein diacylglyceryl transferase [Ohessyouella blattaphilus]MCP1108801.1 prolipoprotein diacylglyceryl transferase [Ohessyouella blattaphilus]MCR8562195.1 prolipoprotein diacylglyceryl transferase [Ohessyouella blattaphilus]